MKKSSIDYSALENKLTEKKAYKLSEVENQLKKVAFDVVRFDSSANIDGLWQIQRGADGDYIVAMYDDENNGLETTSGLKTASDWNVVADRSGSSLSIFYKGTPITRLATAVLGLPAEEAELITSYLPSKLATNGNLVKGLLKEISVQERQELLSKYPELNK